MSKLLEEFCGSIYHTWRIFGQCVPRELKVPSPDFSFEVIVTLNVLFDHVEVDFLRIPDRSGYHYRYNPSSAFEFGDISILYEVSRIVNLDEFLQSVLQKYLSSVFDLIRIGKILCEEGFIDLKGSDMFSIVGGEL